MNTVHTKLIALTMGDPAGIGPEIIAMLYQKHAIAMQNTLVYGDKMVMRRACELVGIPSETIKVIQAGEPFSAESLPIYGCVSDGAGLAAAKAVEAAAYAALRGDVSAIVTAPLHKEALALAGIPYPGHTEMLQALCANVKELPPVRMMLANDELRTVLVSIHVPLREALDSLSAEGIFQTIHITHDFLMRIGISDPRIAVAGINPHAGEGGLFGREEIEVITPAIESAKACGISANGPFAPDTVFMRARKGEFDAVIAMYHDQGLIPVKYLGLEAGVNVTLGLPIIRTSPDHGTAFDLAGNNKADPRGLLYAVQKAREFSGK